MASSRSMDMTEGPIAKQLISFAVPMLIGLVFQQLYNTVDTIVVGNFVSAQALAAVGTTGPLINTLLGFFNGFSAGATVVIARAFGARSPRDVQNAVHTTITMTLILALVITAAGLLLTPVLLRLMRAPDDMLPESTTYLRIYFMGISGLMLYNMGAGILRAVGDSRRPLYFLIFSAIVNTTGDLLLVLVFRMGVAGVAYATILAQGLSALLVLYVLMRDDGIYRLNPRRLRIPSACPPPCKAPSRPSATSLCNPISTYLAPPAPRAGACTASWISLPCSRCSPSAWPAPPLWARTWAR